MCSSTGWLVHEDDECYVLAGRMTCDGEVVGLVERIPKSIVTRVRTLALTPELPPAATQPPAGARHLPGVNVISFPHTRKPAGTCTEYT